MNDSLTNPAPQPEVITRFAGLDDSEIDSQCAAVDAISRRIGQVRAIASMMGALADTPAMDDLPDQTHAFAAWAVRDLLDEAEALIGMLHKLPMRSEAAR